jgi:hypothetical protein
MEIYEARKSRVFFLVFFLSQLQSVMHAFAMRKPQIYFKSYEDPYLDLLQEVYPSLYGFTIEGGLPNIGPPDEILENVESENIPEEEEEEQKEEENASVDARNMDIDAILEELADNVIVIRRELKPSNLSPSEASMSPSEKID